MVQAAVVCLLLMLLPSVAEAEGLGQRIAALKTKAGTSDWDKEVKKLMVAAFDKDGSTMIDRSDEVLAVPCDVWDTLAQRIKSDWRGGLSLLSTYGFNPDRPRYVGEALGIKETMRQAAYERAKNCGVDR